MLAIEPVSQTDVVQKCRMTSTSPRHPISSKMSVVGGIFMSLADLTKSAVDAAIAEYNLIGRDQFLATYGFSDSKRYWLLKDGKRYPSKALAGVAHKYLANSTGPLLPNLFSGGEGTVVRKLRQLGFDVEAPGRNPDWTRDELIIALDLYLTNPNNPPGKASAEVAAVSSLLNKMHRISGGAGSATFRNADGVYLKMMNIRAIDPTFVAQGKVGMKAGGSLEKKVWAEYFGRREILASDAKAIRDAVEQANEPAAIMLEIQDDYDAQEGGVLIRLHKRFERDSKLKRLKLKASKLSGSLACEACAFDFEEAYGELGDGYIEVHHLKPVHLMKQGERTKLKDLALLCSNCHRMAHRKRVPLTVVDLKKAMVKKIGVEQN